MRTIKFRAWDKLNQKMGDVLQYLPYAGENGTVKIANMGSTGYMSHDFELMQFTGLLDKNGKEIYEGDIYHQGDKRILYIVEWLDTGLKGRQNGNKSTAGLSYFNKDIEIIGNIYENPDLLTNN